jgi:glycosyltransferase involved in cell wall biosynthesis
VRYLFVHQNFPGQYRHVAAALAQRGHEVVALGVNPLRESMPGLRHVVYQPRPLPPPSSELPLQTAVADWEAKIARGKAAADAMAQLRRDGFRPDWVAAHPGWGEALFVKDVFPEARLLTYAEYFYGGSGGDADFDPEFRQQSAEGGERLRIKNTHLLHALNDCDAAVSPTRFQKERHPAWAQERIHVIHDGIDTDRFCPDPAAKVRLQGAGMTLSAGDEVVTFACRHLEPYRGYHIFMRALPLLQKLRPQARVVIVGGDDTSYGAKPPPGKSWKQVFLQEVLRDLDLSRVHFVGQLPHPVLTQLMQVSRVHVYLTYPFVLSWSLLEAMSVGCTVVGSDTAPVREVIEDGRNGLLTDFFDPVRLAQATAQALEQADALRPLGLQARQTVIERFDLRRLCLPAHLAMFEN